MMRSVLLVAAGMLAATSCAGFAQTQPGRPAMPPPIGAVPPTARSLSTKAQTPACVPAPNVTFPKERIVDLDNVPFFNPQAYLACGLAGGQDCSRFQPKPGATSQYATLIADVINNNASPALRNHLCGLGYIYVDNSIDPSDQNAGAWGMREVEVDQDGRWNLVGQHIGFRGSLLSGLNAIPQGPPGPFARYESAVTRYLLNLPIPPAQAPSQLAPDAEAWVNAVAYTTPSGEVDPSPPTTAILGVLAHEMGHILWVSAVQSSDQHDPGHVCQVPGLKKRFHQHSWLDRGHQFGFHNFGDIDVAHRPANLRDIVGILRYLGNDQTDNARIALNNLLNTGEWASLFATVSVDEDFVETYMLHQLNLGPLKSFNLVIPPTVASEQPISIDVMAPFSRPGSGLAQKALWIDNCL